MKEKMKRDRDEREEEERTDDFFFPKKLRTLKPAR